jgi:hypothetical protein
MRLDLWWWKEYLAAFNGRSWVIESNRWVNVYVDACGKGAGIVWGDDWYYCNWDKDMPHVAAQHINVKETVAIGLVVRRWARAWSGCSIMVHTDNITALCALNKGASKSPLSMQVVREIFWLSAAFNFKIRGAHIAGVRNIAADTVSRLHSPGSLPRLGEIFGCVIPSFLSIWHVYFACHMSYACFLFLAPQIIQWLQVL